VRIGNLDIENTASLAPMAGVADRAFRELCRDFGACMTTGEMVSAKGLSMHSKKSSDLLICGKNERPFGIQLFGDEPSSMADAVCIAMENKPDFIDLNMGCPAPKIAGNGGGSALMKGPVLAGKIIRAVKDASPVPVSVKFRTGWDEKSINAVEFAKMAEASGADFITVHGRTRAQMYAPPVDIETIALVKKAVSIGVIGNGDITSPEKAKAMYEQTGCDLIAVGRGALGAPWLFSQIRDYLLTGSYSPAPSLEERMLIMIKQVKAAVSYKGEHRAILESRKHCAWYMAGLNGAARLRSAAGKISSLEDLESLAELALSLARS